ncbi:histidine phosphatase family protein [Stenotrophomonas maltophilia]|jgi:broad specificity phosphatase PhoE|uniref:histidine phosphatase family protein n=1 Tax=Stenotrophomonas TaxID=40323 RepID=UPI00244CEC3B|nr:MULTISPECIES: histidine phosphatase family protein [Stenotrophomonas]MDH0072948.1 histidine phosphatase family protein [Stenotrophomonas maltophilia]MDH0105702.1 histidine phosphatase family protein [Stenotrophomonas maltophilia]MDH0331895.1 histidine phosphatase family protein [Stenotrophomonas maltophilia]MDH0633600.1 histidine phosphatase family protein [Stenotrophomonas maltophilia]MDH0642937.1 histidine phosphatase family protein [Stenotrophomonas maltophilia]
MLVVVRHAQSMANAGFVTADPESIALTAAGEEQARALAMTWSAAPDRIFTSPFLRTRQTSQPLAERFKMVAEPLDVHEFTYLSPERCVGTSAADRKQWVEGYWSRCDPNYVDGPGAESFAQLIARAERALRILESYSEHEQVVVFSHGQLMQAMCWIYENKAPSVVNAAAMDAFRKLDLDQPIAHCQRVFFG